MTKMLDQQLPLGTELINLKANWKSQEASCTTNLIAICSTYFGRHPPEGHLLIKTILGHNGDPILFLGWRTKLPIETFQLTVFTDTLEWNRLAVALSAYEEPLVEEFLHKIDAHDEIIEFVQTYTEDYPDCRRLKKRIKTTAPPRQHFDAIHDSPAQRWSSEKSRRYTCNY